MTDTTHRKTSSRDTVGALDQSHPAAEAWPARQPSMVVGPVPGKTPDANANRSIRSKLRSGLERFPRLLRVVQRLANVLRVILGHNFILVPRGQHPIFLEYTGDFSPRWGHGRSSHVRLASILDENRQLYADTLRRFTDFSADFAGLEQNYSAARPDAPNWVNGFIPNLDGISIYSFVAMQTGATYLEVGSGNSTKFARLSIRTRNKRTKIISIDPVPRVEIESLCDEKIRAPLENVDQRIFQRLGEGDILFMDGSHRSFMNSDATVFFTEILPSLNPGVLVGIHDIYLPDDYPHQWSNRFYSEQYLLASYLLGGTKKFRVELPVWMVSQNQELTSLLAPIYSKGALVGLRPHGVTCWIKTLR